MEYKVTLVNGEEHTATIMELPPIAEYQVFKRDNGVKINSGAFIPSGSIMKFERIKHPPTFHRLSWCL